MSDKPSYYELLKHPKWQKKRLEVLEAANWECESCGEKEKTLQVHHTYYEKGLAPWDYPSESLHALCEECHKQAQDRQTLLQRQLGRIELYDVDRLIGYANALETILDPMVVINVFSHEHAMGIADVYGITPSEIINSLRDGQIDGCALLALRKKRRQRT